MKKCVVRGVLMNIAVLATTVFVSGDILVNAYSGTENEKMGIEENINSNFPSNPVITKE